ncbi:hypothetical protein RIF29_39835 [Crotalaria pallida]|uniref:Homeobox-leucine zipper protein n=1 Tax=Crotalaria pallida TaxID=3830 RepID=A0AAN9E7E1_CROPI
MLNREIVRLMHISSIISAFLYLKLSFQSFFSSTQKTKSHGNYSEIQRMRSESGRVSKKGRKRKVKLDMDWNENTIPFSFVSPAESSLSFLYNNNNIPYPEVKQQQALEISQRLLPEMDKMNNGTREKKRRLTISQIESLEKSFQEEIKLEPNRKMKLSKELGLEPRQIAVWFQNRRTRWKAKQLESMYDSLKQEFHVISKEKQKLQDEVMKLKGKLREQALMAQISSGYGGISGEETVESTTEEMHESNKLAYGKQIAENYSSFNVEDYNNEVQLPHWTDVPYYP